MLFTYPFARRRADPYPSFRSAARSQRQSAARTRPAAVVAPPVAVPLALRAGDVASAVRGRAVRISCRQLVVFDLFPTWSKLGKLLLGDVSASVRGAPLGAR